MDNIFKRERHVAFTISLVNHWSFNIFDLKKIIKKELKRQEKQESFEEVKQLVQNEIDNIGQGHLSAANYVTYINIGHFVYFYNSE